MDDNAPNGAGQQDWRLAAELHVGDARNALEQLLGRLRKPALVRELEASVPHDVVITHDGELLFAYAADQDTLASARSAIESVLARDGIDASVRIGHWDEQLDEWVQTDPPPSAGERQARAAAARDAETVETRTLVASAGRIVRTELERSLLGWAGELGIDCKIIEHPHLLSTQIGFTVTGPRRKLDEFARGLKAEEWATIRTETGVMLSPL